MESYVTGALIKSLREKRRITQSNLAEELNVSEKTISKWETGRGFPDISLLEPISKALNVSLIELFNGKLIVNGNKSANMQKLKFYVCPICGNVIYSVGQISISCCGVELKSEEAEEGNAEYVKTIEGEFYVDIASRMTKREYISFIAYVTSDQVLMKKLYPEQRASATFVKNGHGLICYYDNRNGLFTIKV